MSKGYYSLIQYCPDFARAEAVNVGVLVFRSEPEATAVRVVDEVKFVGKRLGMKLHEATVLEVVRAAHYRLTHESFRSVDDLERFVRSRGNDIQLTGPRPMRVDEPEHDVEQLFRELVADRLPVAHRIEVGPPMLQVTFENLARRMPDRVFLGKEFHSRSLGVALRSDYAYRNGCLNLVRTMPGCSSVGEAEDRAYAMAKQGELAADLVEGAARFHVVSTASGKKAEQMESVFRDLAARFEAVHFVPSASAAEWANEVQRQLAGH